uniref:FBD domain-containing protein n=1 Tax=Oryza glumipatula TaxID=40148 RepID=A0A0E0BTF9_9ORYZ
MERDSNPRPASTTIDGRYGHIRRLPKLNWKMLPAEDTVKDIPHLPTVTKLRLDVNTWWYGHTIGATLARIIAKCNNIEHLSILVRGLLEVCSDAQCKCSQPKGWEEQKIQLEHLKKVEFKGFIPFDDRKRLLRLLQENVPALEKITRRFDTRERELRSLLMRRQGYKIVTTVSEFAKLACLEALTTVPN